MVDLGPLFRGVTIFLTQSNLYYTNTPNTWVLGYKKERQTVSAMILVHTYLISVDR